jgi:hypothetical protein
VKVGQPVDSLDTFGIRSRSSHDYCPPEQTTIMVKRLRQTIPDPPEMAQVAFYPGPEELEHLA